MNATGTTTLHLGTEPTAIDLTGDGRLVAVSLLSLDARSPTEVFDVTSGQSIRALGTGLVGRGVAFADEGRTLYHLFERDTQFVFARSELAGGRTEELASYAPGQFCRELRRDSTGRLIAVCGDMVEVWDTANGTRVFSAPPFRKGLPIQAAFDAAGTTLWLWGTVDGNAIIGLDATTWTERVRIPAPAAAGTQLAISPSGARLVAVATATMGVFVYDTPRQARIVPDRYGDTTYSGRFAFSQDDNHLVNLIGGAVLIDRLEPRELLELHGLGDEAAALAVADYRPVVAASWKNGTIVSFEWNDEPPRAKADR